MCFVFFVPTDLGIHRPERWEDLPDAVQGMPGVYSHMLSFLAGPHACIGFRFSVAECVPQLLCVEHDGDPGHALLGPRHFYLCFSALLNFD